MTKRVAKPHATKARKPFFSLLMAFVLVFSLAPVDSAHALDGDEPLLSVEAGVHNSAAVQETKAPDESEGSAVSEDNGTQGGDTRDDQEAPEADTQREQEPSQKDDGLNASEKSEDGDDAGSFDEDAVVTDPVSAGHALLTGLTGLQSEEVPLSAAATELEPGTYTITANLYVDGADAPIGVNVYLGDGGFPPIKAQKMNSTLVVGEDGTLTVTTSANQEIFTLQDIKDGPDTHIKSIKRGGKIDWMGEPPAVIPYTDRITELTVELGNASGQYSFSDCVEYPVVLNVDKNWTIHLSVDFASAVRQIEGDFEKTFTDAATGVSVTVKAEEGSPLIPKLQDATFSAAEVTEGDVFDRAKKALDRSFSTNPEFKLYSMGLTADGEEIVLDNDASASVSIPTNVANASLYRIDGSSATEESSTKGDGALAFDTRALGTFAVVDADAATAWAGVKTLTGDIPGVSLTYSTTGWMELNYLGMDFDTFDSYGLYNAYFDRQTEGVGYQSALSIIENLDTYDQVDIEGMYALGFDLSMEAFPYANQQHAPFTMLGATYQTSLSATVPATGPGSLLYVVSGTVGEGMTSVQMLDATVIDGVASFDLVSKDEELNGSREQALSALWNAASGWDGQFDSNAPDAHNWTSATKLAYVVVAREAPVEIDKPVAVEGLVYDGSAQVGVAENEGYDLIGDVQATDAGDYTAIATLKDGYAWADGSTSPAAVSWSIAKASLVATYVGEEIPANGTPQLAVGVTGFVNGEGAASAKGFFSPLVSAPDVLEAGKTYELTPEGGEAANYAFVYRSGTLRVTDAVDPETFVPGTYTITANLAMPGQYNPLIPGLTVYANSPDNPFGPTIDENDPSEVHDNVPSTPLSMNATLVVGADGTKTLLLPIKNPIFTTQSLGSCDELTDVKVERVGPTDGGGTYSGSYNNRTDRIHKMLATLTDGLAGGMAEYNFKGSVLYAVPLDLELAPGGDIALQLTVDYDSAVRVSDSTVVPSFGGGGGNDSPGNDGGGGNDNPGNGGGNTAPNPNSGSTAPTNNATQQNSRLAAGTYTVSANIWFDKADTGLPLNPHLTNGGFPPMNPVADNATLTVGADGRATVHVPIVIQSRIMTVNSVSGLNIVNSSSSGGGLSSITVDLGVLDGSTAVVTESCTASVTIGDLAMTIGGAIFGGTRDHTYPATFQMNLSGVPTSGGGTVPAAVLDVMNGGDGSGLATAEEAAEAAAEAAKAAKAKNASEDKGGSGSESALDDLEDALATNPALSFGLGALTTLVVGGAAVGGVYAYRRKKMKA